MQKDYKFRIIKHPTGRVKVNIIERTRLENGTISRQAYVLAPEDFPAFIYQKVKVEDLVKK